ncbi:hypothetical protein CPB83DRAFT_842367 [Crepidotus variabilis]|uniref:Uncharacterized protein n=1 Tax=Crepidotus variabilis TaxID=179855 RepID=A0A9P6JWK7_9AGAR|nr:hypothetical protein CPB83DRAFT_842367 [Crepidotus variabilis]
MREEQPPPSTKQTHICSVDSVWVEFSSFPEVEGFFPPYTSIQKLQTLKTPSLPRLPFSSFIRLQMPLRRTVSMPNMQVRPVKTVVYNMTSEKSPEWAVQPRLPSYEEVMDQVPRGEFANGRLPSFKKSFSARYHPYKRPALKRKDVTDRFMNTIFDPQYEPLNVPPPRPGMSSIPPLEPNCELMIQALKQRLREIEFARRAHRLNAVMKEFVEGVRLAHLNLHAEQDR